MVRNIFILSGVDCCLGVGVHGYTRSPPTKLSTIPTPAIPTPATTPPAPPEIHSPGEAPKWETNPETIGLGGSVGRYGSIISRGRRRG